ILLVDTSQSMGVASPSRMNRVRALLRRSRAGLQSLGADHALSVFTFSDALEEATLDGPLPDPAGGTRIFEAIQAARARLGHKEIGSVIVVSDGHDHGRLDGVLDPAARAELGRIGAPVHGVLMSEDRPIPDLSIGE